jgi:hypothetical protein
VNNNNNNGHNGNDAIRCGRNNNNNNNNNNDEDDDNDNNDDDDDDGRGLGGCIDGDDDQEHDDCDDSQSINAANGEWTYEEQFKQVIFFCFKSIWVGQGQGEFKRSCCLMLLDSFMGLFIYIFNIRIILK